MKNTTDGTAGLEVFDLIKRILAAAVLLPILLAILLVAPTICTAILFGLMAAIGAYELLWGTGLVKQIRLLVYSAIMAFGTALWCFYGMPYVWGLLGFLAFLCALYAEELACKAKLPYKNLMVCVAAGVVIPFMLCAPVRILTGEYGRYFILIPFALAFLSDTGAYFAGRFFGKHKLAPVISPNKTVEGVVGGVLATMLGMVIYCVVLQFVFQFRVNYLYALLYGLLGSLAGVFGDLSFSAIKRQTGIKDYGNLIPGHGGILDRFDSMTVVAPLAEILMILLPLAVM